MLLLIDNFDSFTYNLVHAFQMLGIQVRVVSNDVSSIEECLTPMPEWLVISPGPGNPRDAGISMRLINHCRGKFPILGVCLGHQAMAEVFGGTVEKALKPIHGFLSQIYHVQKGLFSEIPSPFLATRYHSLIVTRENLPSCLEITAKTKEGEIMALRHREYAIDSVQFHPEALLTEYGLKLLNNFLNREHNYYAKENLCDVDRSSMPNCLIR